ncbi:Hydroxyproline-rich glycoprotein family protein [Gossypium australe]|uniref:Hydroxyproline-rich glycoprotein family protein n=1 Tax=Gossypium australe TaxID=47621 RepID=A0A5B6W5R6_9ROSI|nr:Hydroxyproline-rich glycoprotein family protein [Gossypium australe]
MENEESSSSRPAIGFPLGLALLLILLFCISAVLLCYLYWQKLRALILRSSDQDQNDIESDIGSFTGPRSFVPCHGTKPKGKIVGQSMPVLMPGDKVPRFIAMASPCEPPRTETITITVPKPPALSVPFYYS